MIGTLGRQSWQNIERTPRREHDIGAIPIGEYVRRARSRDGPSGREIAGLRNPMRIDIIARRQLGLTAPLPTQVREYEAPAGAEVAAVRYVRPNRTP